MIYFDLKNTLKTQKLKLNTRRVEAGYNDIGKCNASSIASDVQWFQLIPHC